MVQTKNLSFMSFWNPNLDIVSFLDQDPHHCDTQIGGHASADIYEKYKLENICHFSSLFGDMDGFSIFLNFKDIFCKKK